MNTNSEESKFDLNAFYSGKMNWKNFIDYAYEHFTKKIQKHLKEEQ